MDFASEATLQVTILWAQDPRGGEYFPVHEVMPAAETQRARRNGAAVRVPGKDCVPEQEEKDFHSFHREDRQTTAGSKTFYHHEGKH